MERERFDEILLEEGIPSKDFRDHLWLTQADRLDVPNAEEILRKTCRQFLAAPGLKRRMEKEYGN